MTVRRTLLLTKQDVLDLINMPDVIQAVEEAYKAISRGDVVQPDYMTVEQTAPGRGELDIKACYFPGNEGISIKFGGGGYTENPKKYGFPTGFGMVVLFDATTCFPVCVMDSSLITGYRTGAAGAVSVKCMARKDARVVTSIGTGNQARNQIRAISQVMDIQEVYAYDRFPASVEAFKRDMEAEFSIPVHCCATAQEAVSHADVLVTTTRGTGDFIQRDWVKPGTHIAAIGADQQGKKELDARLFKGARVIVDSMPQCVSKGETWNALHEGIITQEEICGELGEVLLGQKVGRASDQEITIFDTTGTAMQDNTTSFAIYHNAVKQGRGQYFDFYGVAGQD